MTDQNKSIHDPITLVPATIDLHPILQNMGRFYVYDMSEFFSTDPDWSIPEDGLYECIDLKKYWLSDNTWPYLIRIGSELAGFAIIDKKGSEPQVDFNMAQFFILRKFKGKGVGKFVAYHCFNHFKGKWEIMVMPENKGAYDFWKKIITQYTTSNFTEFHKKVKHLSDSEKIIFAFTSKI
jgi:[ribosomal protein S5]-alanine N-acetyltransferase